MADWYLSEKAAGQHRGRYLDLFYFVRSAGHVNKQWMKMWKRVLHIIPFGEFAQAVERLNRYVPGYRAHLIPDDDVMPTTDESIAYISGKDPRVYAKYNKRLKSILESEKPNLYFTDIEEMRGARDLKTLGIPDGNPFICFHARDSAFLDAVMSGYNWLYHDYRDSSIQNYIRATDDMTQRGCYAIRIGAIVKERVDSVNPKIIDYATNGMRTDFLDIYLSEKCRFVLCSDTGMSFPAEVFKKPIVFVNWAPLLRTPVYVSNGLVIYKKFYLKKERRYMTFSEVMNLKFGGKETNEIFSKLNLELIENTPEEIGAVTIEMDERLNGAWETTKEDEELQQRFWALFGPEKFRSPNLRVGADFLRENKNLLE